MPEFFFFQASEAKELSFEKQSFFVTMITRFLTSEHMLMSRNNELRYGNKNVFEQLETDSEVIRKTCL